MARILIVDDSISIRGIVRHTLEKAGHRVDEASDGLEGLQTCSRRMYDLIFVDINMPRMDGFKFVTGLRKTSGGGSVPIVFLTSEARAEQKDIGRSLGASGWITKPVEPSLLFEAVHKFVR